MKIIGLRDFRELRQSNAFRVMLVVVTAVTIAASVGISIALGRLAWLGEETARPLLVLIISLVAYFLPFLIIMAFTWGFASLPVIKEKINGNIECLLATPISPGAIWMGKCLAIFLPGFAIAVISTLIVLLVINLTAIVPAAGVF
ncbi:MAG TPA: hypothetical protein VLH15_10875, partial [Dehalococcoidales bacterium]|nr:hypothetical protein [Dehalococcoidales bacterium]